MKKFEDLSPEEQEVYRKQAEWIYESSKENQIRLKILKLQTYDLFGDSSGCDMLENHEGTYLRFEDVISLFYSPEKD